METGSHDPARDMGRPWTRLDSDGTFTETDRGDWVTLPDGGIVPPKLAGRTTGWDGDRDSSEPLKAATARKAMADAVTKYHVAKGRVEAMAAAGFGDMVAETLAVMVAAEAMAAAWQDYSDATGGAA